MKQLRQLGVPKDLSRRITSHIIASRRHLPRSSDAALVIDIDLTILGAPRRVFESFERQVRREYAHIPEPLFQRGRSAVLRSFLSRRRIFSTPQIRARLERQV